MLAEVTSVVTSVTLADVVGDFLAQRRLAVVGVSRRKFDFSRRLFRELRDLGYDVVPVNPQATQIEGRRCYARVSEIDPPVDAAVIITPPEETDAVVADCLAAGVLRVWLHHGRVGRGAVAPGALALGEAAGMTMIAGFCPFMFLPDTDLFHLACRALIEGG